MKRGCPLLCILTSKHMLAHVFAWSKTMKNIWKSWKKYLFHHACERLMKKILHAPYIILFYDFSMLFINCDHANACVKHAFALAKYTTPRFLCCFFFFLDLTDSLFFLFAFFLWIWLRQFVHDKNEKMGTRPCISLAMNFGSFWLLISRLSRFT